MTTNNPLLAKGWKPSPLMVRILTAFVFLGVVIGLVLAGIYGVYLLVLILGGLALYEFNGLSDLMGSRAPAWLLFPLGVFFAFSGTALKQVDVTLVLALALVGGLGAFLFLPGQRQGLGRWAMGLAGALYIGMPFNFYLLLYTSKPHGLVWTLFTILAVIANDAAALLVGSRIGRHPFFATISPHKTVEGAGAGVVASVIAEGVRWFGSTEAGCSASCRGEYVIQGQAGEPDFDSRVIAMVTDPRCDIVVVDVPGARALAPTMAALEAKKEIALATK